MKTYFTSQILPLLNDFFLKKLHYVVFSEKGEILFANEIFYNHYPAIKTSSFVGRNFHEFFTIVKNIQQNTLSEENDILLENNLIKFSHKDSSVYYDSIIIYNRRDKYNIFIGNDLTEFLTLSSQDLAYYRFINEILEIDLSYAPLEEKLKKIMTKLEKLLNLTEYGIYSLNIENQSLELIVSKISNLEFVVKYKQIPLHTQIEVLEFEDLENGVIIKKNIPSLYDTLLEAGFEFIPIIYQNQFIGIFFYKANFHRTKDFEYFLQSFTVIILNIIYKKILLDSINNEFKKLSEMNDKLVNILEENLNVQNLIFRYIPRKTFFKVRNSLKQGFKITNERNFYYFLFLDLVDFTKFSEGKDPEFVIQSLNSYFSHLADIVYDNDGDIDKFMGDNIFAYFSTADDALKASIEMIHFFTSHKPADFPPFQAKIALHCGEAIHGNIGNQFRSEFTLIGDAVNTTSKIQKACKPNDIIISEEFHQKLKNKKIPLSKRYLLKVKGKQQPIGVYFVLYKMMRMYSNML